MHNSIPRYSLQRIRKSIPAPPYWAGGEFLNLNGRPYLKNFSEAIALLGNPALFEGLATGDLIYFAVSAVEAGAFACEDREIIFASVRERPRPRPHAPGFSRFNDQIRTFLKSRGLGEIFTPTLVTCPGLEPSLEAFATTVTRGPLAETKYLPTSPEVHLKKALARGLTDIFEIRPCFRRGEFGDHHANEFWMLEWYRGFADLDLIIEDLRELVQSVAGSACYPQVTDFAALFRQEFKFSLTPATTRDELAALASQRAVEFSPADTFTDIFHRLMIAHLEPAMEKMGPLIVRNFPPSMAALAKITEAGWADRFEFYWNGLEIANAFNEVTDAQEQRRRWEGELSERERLGTGPLPMDIELIEALEMGLPPTGGIALGLERLYMAVNGVKNIGELSLF